MQEEHTNLMKLAVISGPDTLVEPTQGPAGAWAVQVLWTPVPTAQHPATPWDIEGAQSDLSTWRSGSLHDATEMELSKLHCCCKLMSNP